jgi:hypothetical protein
VEPACKPGKGRAQVALQLANLAICAGNAGNCLPLDSAAAPPALSSVRHTRVTIMRILSAAALALGALVGVANAQPGPAGPPAVGVA